ncbi:MAG: DUF2845 domain-containing protein [Proteobacteria bacterium]|nr:DUF2845 domain-containing protein [Pseudomonadota bacterium]
MYYIFFIILATFVYFPATLFADTFRCGSEIVSTGESKATVVMRCGNPHWVGGGKIAIVGDLRFGSRQVGRQTYGAADYSEQATNIDIWYYDCGADVFVNALTFEGDRLIKIESTSRGTGKRKCGPQ